MQFRVIESRRTLANPQHDTIYLVIDNWDDWFRFSTMYSVFYFTAGGEEHRIGEVKIGQFGMQQDQRRAAIPESFQRLTDDFFSLGQDDSYYATLKSLGDEVREEYFSAMQDVARNAELFERALNEDVMGVSLLRSVSDQSVRGQYRRIAQGGARLTNYTFSYTPTPWGRGNLPPTFEFRVVPGAFPPTNVHVLIGRNNVGKTYTVDQMTNALVRPNLGEFGQFEWIEQGILNDAPDSFSNIISVTFSAFDAFEPLPNTQNKLSSARYEYIGLKRVGQSDDGSQKPPKSPDDLAADFGKSVQLILQQASKRERWRNALTLLESDPIFKQAEIWGLIEQYQTLKEQHELRDANDLLRRNARQLYGKLSSGHKIVVLSITRLVETLEERSLVLLDEPEAHLHPPLLSAFIRTLSDLLINRNGVAIIATHSPVILQEVPRTCVWQMWRNGTEKRIERPVAETFGENVGTLTHAVFGLEVTSSGFYRMISDAVEEGLDYDELTERFGGQMGGEARGIARSLIASRNEEN